MKDNIFPTNPTSFEDIIVALKGQNPDVVFAAGEPSSITLLFQQLKELKYWPKLGWVGCGGGYTNPTVVQNLGSLAEGMLVINDWFPDINRPGSKELNERFKKRTGGKDLLGNANTTYAAVYILADALQRAGSPDGSKIRDALAIQLLLLGLLQGGIYALVACGLTLIYGLMKVVNFAHAEFLTLGMFLAITAFQLFGLNPYTAAPFIFAIVFILGAIAQQIIIRPALRYPQINQMLITIGLSILLVGMMQLLWGPNNQVVKLSWARATFDFEIAGGEVSLSYVRLIAAVVAVAVAGLAWWILKYTRTGNAMRAAAQNPLAARLMGINVSRINLLTFGFGTGLAALSGALISPAFFVNPTFGTDYFILAAFVIVVLGTMGNFVGALVGGLIIGMAEALGGLFLGAAMRQFVSLSVFVIVLLFLPRGIFRGRMS